MAQLSGQLGALAEAAQLQDAVCCCLSQALLPVASAQPSGRRCLQIFVHPWFQSRLPKGLDALNHNLMSNMARKGMQSVEEIEFVVQKATQVEVKAWKGAFPVLALLCMQLRLLSHLLHALLRQPRRLTDNTQTCSLSHALLAGK